MYVCATCGIDCQSPRLQRWVHQCNSHHTEMAQVCVIAGSPCGRMCVSKTWWRHLMETFSAWLAICAGNSPVPGEFTAQRPVTRSFDVFFDLRLNKRLSKQSWGWWFETSSCPLWRHRNGCQNPHLQRWVHQGNSHHTEVAQGCVIAGSPCGRMRVSKILCSHLLWMAALKINYILEWSWLIGIHFLLCIFGDVWCFC